MAAAGSLSSIPADGNADDVAEFKQSRADALRCAGFKTIQERDSDANQTLSLFLAYKFENLLVSQPSMRYQLLCVFTIFMMVVRDLFR